MSVPSTACADYTAMQSRWSLITALRGGTVAMRSLREQGLPRHPKEQPDHYDVRLQNSYLVPFLDDTIQTLVGRAFGQDWVYEGGLPQPWMDDIDLAGNNLNQFARLAFDDSLAYGKTHLLVDIPARRDPSNRTLEADRRQGRRPYLTHIPARAVIAWRYRIQDGKEVLTHLRWKETVEVEDGRWSTKKVERIRVVEPGRWEIYEGDSDALVDSGETGLDYIPLVTHYSRRVGFMTSLPTFENLAHMNHRHWCTASDQNHILRICRVPIIKGTGLTDQDEITISPNSFVRLPQGADLGYCVMDPGGIDAGWRDLERVEMQCRLLGMQPLMAASGDRTATEAAINAANTHTTLKALMTSFKDTLELALGYAADLAGMSVEQGGTLQPNTNLGTSGDPLEMQNLILMYQQGLIRGTTLLMEAKRRGLLSDDVDVTAEIDSAATATPVLTGAALDLDAQ